MFMILNEHGNNNLKTNFFFLVFVYRLLLVTNIFSFTKLFFSSQEFCTASVDTVTNYILVFYTGIVSVKDIGYIFFRFRSLCLTHIFYTSLSGQRHRKSGCVHPLIFFFFFFLLHIFYTSLSGQRHTGKVVVFIH